MAKINMDRFKKASAELQNKTKNKKNTIPESAIVPEEKKVDVSRIFWVF